MKKADVVCARVSCHDPGVVKVKMDRAGVWLCRDHAEADQQRPFVPQFERPAPMVHYSRALDEVYRLRAILAYEAMVTDAHHEGYKTFPRSRKRHVVEQAERMRRAARGEALAVYSGIPYPQRALRDAGAPETLTRSSWEGVLDGERI